MGTKSKFFRAFVEGNTISDGRTITAAMIDEIVATFNVETYTPRINVEHINGYSPEPPFNGYGSVIAVKAQDDKFTIDGAEVTRRALYAQVDANPQLIDLAKRDQKPFPSVELTPSYAGVGKTGLIGLAFTDKPASIGTQSLQFSRTSPGTFFAVADEAPTLEFEAATPDAGGVTAAIVAGFASVASIFATKKSEPAPDPAKEEPKAPANDNFSAAITAMGTQIAAAIKPIADGQAAAEARFAAIEAKLDATPADGQFQRQPATGGASAVLTEY